MMHGREKSDSVVVAAKSPLHPSRTGLSPAGTRQLLLTHHKRSILENRRGQRRSFNETRTDQRA
jgi:hypothetical protein